MQRDTNESISNNEREFIIKGVKEDIRIDGRTLYEHRKIEFDFSLDDASATVHLGCTRVLATVTAALEAPMRGTRGREGSARFHVDLSPMASPAFEGRRHDDDTVELARMVERTIRQSGALDMEALCVLPGSKVWHLRVDITVLDHCGNLVDAVVLAALAALTAFRKPQVSVDHGEAGAGEPRVIIHPPEVREPQPLSLHHLPLAVSFALFHGGSVLAVDPTLAEACAAEGLVTLALNPHGEVCAVHKADGVGLHMDELMRCLRLAGASVKTLVEQLKQALERHEVARVKARVRRKQPGSAAAAGGAAGGEAAGTGAGDGWVVVADRGDAAAQRAALYAEVEAAKAALAACSADSPDDSSSSSSSSGGDGDSDDGARAVGARASLPAASGADTGSGAVKGEPHLTSSQGTQQQQQGGAQLAGGGHKRALQPAAARPGAGGRPRFGSDKPVASLDSVEQIAAIIAGAGKDEPPVPNLAAAIKPKSQRR